MQEVVDALGGLVDDQALIRGGLRSILDQEPEDVARAVLFLAKEPFVTGEILTVDGGRSLNP